MSTKNEAESAAFLIKQLRTIEEQLDTQAYLLNEIWAWPFIRTIIVGKYYRNLKLSGERKRKVTVIERATKKISHLSKKLSFIPNQLFSGSCIELPKTARPRVAAMLRSSRLKRCNGRCVEPITMPVLEELRKKGAETELWSWETNRCPTELGVEVLELGRELDRAIHARKRWKYIQTDLNQPRWFAELEAIVERRLGIELRWEAVKWLFVIVDRQADVFRETLEKRKIDLLITDCWYDWPIAAARFAAFELQKQCIELQHGIQEQTHECFHEWTSIPPAGYYNPFPDFIWVWGEAAAEMYSSNVFRPRILIGGNLFLNAAVAAFRQSRERGRDLRIGYTLTHPLHRFVQDIETTITACPNSWTWVFRNHPSDKEGKAFLRELKNKLPTRKIDIETGQTNSVIEFLSTVDVHATHDSTCALEALALGMPSIITTEFGLDYFARWISAGVHIPGVGATQFFEAVSKALVIPKWLCEMESRRLFAPQSAAEEAVKEIFAVIIKKRTN
jgi:hypothetical protein